MKVSVLLPLYNHAPYVKVCLDSLKAQSFADWEAILIDDCSTDEGLAIARRETQGDSRFRVDSNPENLGTYGTLDRARAMARGEWIAVLNTDDLWEPKKLQRQLEAVAEHPEAALVITMGTLVDETGQPYRTQSQDGAWPCGQAIDLRPFLVAENRVLASSVLFRGEALRFEPSLRYSGDWVALLRHSALGPSVCLSQRLTSWRQHSTNTYRQSPAQVAEEIRVRTAIQRSIPATSEMRRGLALNALHLSALFAFFEDQWAFRQQAGTAVRLDPSSSAAWRRWVASCRPGPAASRRLWRHSEKDLSKEELEAWRDRIAAQEPLELFASNTAR